MLTLAFDTSSSKGSVAVLKDEDVLSEVLWSRETSHGELLTPALQKALEQAELDISSIDLIAIGNGPGSFTGVRIAVNAARAIAYSTKKPVLAFDSSEILAGCIDPSEGQVLTLINAQKNLVFASTFSYSNSLGRWEREGSLQPLPLEQLHQLVTKPLVCVGDGYLEYEALLDPGLKSSLIRRAGAEDVPTAPMIGRMASRLRNQRPTLNWNAVQPLYIRASGAEEKLEENRQKMARK